MTSPALKMDKYELSMLQSFIQSGMVDKKATFEVFTRKLQPGFRYGVFAGTGRLLPMIENLEFAGKELAYLREAGIVDRDTYLWLSDFTFSGHIDAYREGDLYFPNSPVLTVTGTLGECLILETLVLSVLNHDSSIATKAARMVSAAKGRPIIEMGSRRTHEESAVAAARAAYIAGFASTSNLAAGMEYGIPVVGTAAHAFTLAHGDERDAFASQMRSHGPETTLLVDTYDIPRAVEDGVSIAQDFGADGPGAVRIDSGDLALEAYRTRKQLDELGARDTKITVTSDLDEYVIKDLQSAPIDGYGVGTKLVSTPPAGFVYKLVAIEAEVKSGEGPATWSDSTDCLMRPVAKKAKDKVSVGGRKAAYRVLTEGMREEYVVQKDGRSHYHARGKVRVLQDKIMENGRATSAYTADQAREFHKTAFAELPKSEQQVWSGDHGPFLKAEEV